MGIIIGILTLSPVKGGGLLIMDLHQGIREEAYGFAECRVQSSEFKEFWGLGFEWASRFTELIGIM